MQNGEAAFTTYEGSASITQIQPGQYTICEETPAEGYTKAADIAVTVSQTHIAASPAAAGMKNGVTAISLNKVDAQSGSPIGGAVFPAVGRGRRTGNALHHSGQAGLDAAGPGRQRNLYHPGNRP